MGARAPPLLASGAQGDDPPPHPSAGNGGGVGRLIQPGHGAHDSICTIRITRRSSPKTTFIQRLKGILLSNDSGLLIVSILCQALDPNQFPAMRFMSLS